jgi:HEAT repeat protein
MRCLNATIILCLASVVLVNCTTSNEHLALMNRNLVNPNPSVRREAMKHIAIDQPERAGNDILPVLQRALSDEDADVRRYAAAAIARVSYESAANPDYKAKHGVKTEPRAYPKLAESLLNAITNEDAQVRENVVKALWFGFPPDAKTGSALARQYDVEKSPQVRIAIIGALARGQYSSADGLVIRGLDDPDSEVRGWAAHALSEMKQPPAAALEKVVLGLKTEQEPFTRQKFISAIGAYGKKASPHLPALRTAMQIETNEVTKLTFANTIRQIENSR